MALFGGANDIRIRFLADTTQVGQGVKEMGGGIASGLGMASIGWAAAGAAAGAFAKQSVDAAMEAEDAQNRLHAAYAKFPALHDVTLSSLNDLADATLKKSRYDDEAARSAITLLAQYHLTGAQIQELLPLVTDFAAKTGKELPDAAQAIGKALLGNTRALKDVGINYKMTGDAATDYANIVKLLTQQVGGAAADDLDTTAGKLAQLKNQYGELQEAFGAALLPLIQYLAPALIAILEVLAMSFKGWGLMFTWVGEHADVLLQALLFLVSPLTWLLTQTNIVSAALGWLGAAFSAVAGFISGVFAGAVNAVIGVLNAAWGVISDVAGVIGGAFAGAWHVAVGAINAVAHAVEWVMDKLRALQSLARTVGGILSSLNPFSLSAPPSAGGMAIAPTAGVAAYGAPRAMTGSAAGGTALTVQVNIHGNVGDPNLIGRRTVDALATYVRTNGAHALKAQLGLAPA